MDRELLLERLERLAIVLDELMPQCAELVRDALALLKEQEEEIENLKQTAQSMMEGICLLKEQEAVEPRMIDGKRNHFIKCGNCNYDLMTGFQFCPHCGRAVKWE